MKDECLMQVTRMTDIFKLEVSVIIFDFDGVIVDSGKDIANAVIYTLKHFNRPLLPKEEIISYVGRGVENLIRRSFKDSNEDIIAQAIPVYREYYLRNCVVETKLYSNVKETLEFFAEKKLALVTNKPEDMTRRILDAFGIEKYFKLIVGPESVKKMKPDPEGIQKVLDLFDERPEKAIMVGDSYTDILAGKKAHTYTCGVTYGIGSTKELIEAGPNFVFDDIIKLTETLR